LWLGEDFGFAEHDIMFPVELVFCHFQLIMLCDAHVTVAIFFFGLNQPATLPNVDQTSS
jgi:hypothetical protein